jgi:DNA-binding transcriptional LysR family regulator
MRRIGGAGLALLAATNVIAQLETAPLRQDHRPLTMARLALLPQTEAAGLCTAVQIVLGEHRHEAERGSDDHGVLSPRTWRVVDLATKHALIVTGLGWGHMPEHVVRDDLRAGRLVALELEAWGPTALRRSLVLVRRRDVVMGPVARWAQARLGELCRRNVEPDAAPNHPT